VDDPASPTNPGTNTESATGAFIVCEGIWHYDNSSLSRLDFKSSSMIADYYSVCNTGMKLGDLANGGVIYKGYLYLVMTTPAIIEKIDIKTGKSVARLNLKANSDPRKICIVNDHSAYITCLRSYSVAEIDPTDMTLKNTNIAVGPAPEYIANYKNLLFVANSGYGDFLADKPKAGTISVIDTNSRAEIKTIECGPNLIELKTNAKRGKLYAVYYHLPSLTDSVGGIVEYDLPSMKETRRLRAQATSITFSNSSDTLLFLSKKGVNIIDLNKQNLTSELYIKNPKSEENWYSLVVSPQNQIWIGNARSYQALGELLIYPFSANSSLLSKYGVGINPGTILFY
jgi:hypothetical protein